MAPRQKKRSAAGGSSKTRNKKAKVSRVDSLPTIADVEQTHSGEEDSESDEAFTTTLPEIVDLSSVHEKMKKAQHVAKENIARAEQMHAEVDKEHEALLSEVAEHKTKIDADRKAFEESVWPILTAALAPCSITSSITVGPPPISVSETIATKASLYRDTVDLGGESRKLIALLEEDSKRALPPSRIPAFQASLKDDKIAVLESLHAGRKVATGDVQRRLAKQDGSEVRQQNMSEDEKRKGMLLMRWGSEGADTSVMHDSALGEITIGLTKAVSKLEKLAHQV